MRGAGESRRSQCPPDPVCSVRREIFRKRRTRFKRDFRGCSFSEVCPGAIQPTTKQLGICPRSIGFAARADASQTQGKIERGHQPLKNCPLPENDFLPGDLEARIEAFAAHYNHPLPREPEHVTPADVHLGKAPAIIKQRERIRRQTIEYRRLQDRKLAA